MIKKLLVIAALNIILSGCFMAPLAFIGPVTSGFSTASVMQSTVSSGANYLVKKSTGKSITEHAFDRMSPDTNIFHQTYFPKRSETLKIAP